MAFMAQQAYPGYRTWTCGCGRWGLAAALDACPSCEAPQPGTEPAAEPPPEPRPAPTRTRPASQRRRSSSRAKGG